MKKNIITKGIEAVKEINKDVAVYDNTVKKAQDRFWAKHPVCKKAATVATVALVVANVALSLDEAGVFEGIKEKVKEVKEKKKTTPAETIDVRVTTTKSFEEGDDDMPAFKENNNTTTGSINK